MVLPATSFTDSEGSFVNGTDKDKKINWECWDLSST
jgi:hypothetical protein